MTNVKNYLLILPLLVLLSCGSEETPVPEVIDDEPEPIVITVSDFEITIDENPEEQQIIGNLVASSKQGDVTFSIVSQSISGALTVNGETGQLAIGNVAAFDFETNSSISGVFAASLGGESEEADFMITINDVAEPINLSAYAYVEQTGETNPFDGFDVGTDAYPSTVDVDGDGDLDLVVGSQEGTFTYLKNENGVFTQVSAESNPFAAFDVGSDSRHTFADADGDGDMDLISGSGGGVLFYYENNEGVYTYKTENHILDDFAHNTIDSKPAFIDYDNDGDMDMFVGFFNQVALWENTGDAFARSASTIYNASLDQTHQFPMFADLNLDGKEDLIAGRHLGDFRLLTESEDGSYKVATDLDIFSGLDVGSYSSPAFIDLDGDGLLEMISGNGEGTIKYFKLVAKK